MSQNEPTWQKMSDIRKPTKEEPMGVTEESDRGMLMARGDQNMVKRDNPTVMESQDYLFELLDSQYSLMLKLRERLDSVLKPDMDDSSEKASPSPARHQSPMMGRMLDLHARVSYNTSIINDLLLRLEV